MDSTEFYVEEINWLDGVFLCRCPGDIHIHFHDIQTYFFFETTWSVKEIL